MAANVTIADLSASTSAPRLRVGITVAKPIVDASLTYARGAVSAAQLSTQATCVVPVSAINYVLLATSAYLDETGRFKFLQEITAVTDQASLHVSKGALDLFDVSDVMTLQTNKGLSETVSFVEVFTRTLIFIRNLSDTLNISEAKAFALTKPLADSILGTDSSIRTFGKSTVDAVVLTDTPSMAVSKYVPVESIVVSDSVGKYALKSLAEFSAVTDSGFLTAQSYCDPTYLAEDYVGSSRTF